jgi:hypothetical protein
MIQVLHSQVLIFHETLKNSQSLDDMITSHNEQ